MHCRRRIRLAAVCTCFVMMICSAVAQTAKGSISGTVVDSAGASVNHAAVTALALETGYVQTTTTNASGVYIFPLLALGKYELKISAPGFESVTQTGIQLSTGATVTLNFSMHVGAQQTTVAVKASAVQLLDAETPTLHDTLDNVQVQELPVQTRDIMSLVRVLPGVVPTQPSTAIGADGNRDYFDNGFAINGSRTSSNELLINGVPDTIGDFNGIALEPPMTAVNEFQVVTGAVSAEYGRTSGGVVSMTTLSGTNVYHGSLYGYFQNSVLNANGWQNNHNHVKRASAGRGQFGATFGGPVYIPHLYNGRNKTFFFFNYEGMRERSPYDPGLMTVPTAAERTGDFSALPFTIYDPTTTQCADPSCTSYTRTAFSGNKIPDTRIDPVAAAATKYYPLPNVSGANYIDNYIFGGVNPIHINTYDVRIDENVSSKHNLFAQYAASKHVNTTPDYLGTGASSGRTIYDTFHYFVFGDDYSILPTLVNDFRLGYVRAHPNQVPISYGFDPGKLGFPGYLSQFATVLQFPNIGVGDNHLGMAQLGGEGYNNQPRDTISLNEGVIYLHGNHEIHLGTGLRLYRFMPFQTISPTGNFSFSGVYTQANPLKSDTTSGIGMATFLLGAMSPGSYDEYITPLTIFHRYFAFYGQDTWKVTSKLTVDYGLRWERESGTEEARNRITYFDPSAASPLNGQVPGMNLQGTLEFAGGTNPRTIWDTPFTGFGPRIGVAYAINSQTVVRAGFSIFYLPLSLEANTAQGFNEQDDIDQPSPITPSVFLQNPFPGGLAKPTGRAAGTSVDLGQPIYAQLRNISYPNNQMWNVSVQRAIGQTLMVEADYVGSRGRHLPLNGLSLSQVPDSYLSLGSALAKQVANPFHGVIHSGPLSAPNITQGALYTKYPQYNGVISNRPNLGDSWYESMQLQVVKRYSRGLSLQASYTWSKTLDIGGVGNGAAFTDPTAIQDVYNLKAEKALSDQDVPNALLASGVYDLPVGRGRGFGANLSGWENAILGGWQAAGTWIWQGGRPFTLAAPNNNIGFFNPTERPNLVPGVDPNLGLSAAHKRVRQGLSWFNTAAFSVPAPYTYGNMGRKNGGLRDDSYKDVDFSIHKSFLLTQRATMQFRAEAFNALEQTVFSNPNTSVASSLFGIVLTQANTPRVYQFAINTSF